MMIIDEMTGRLEHHVRVDAVGVKTLSHVMVVVPTAQSGRRLRFALAARFGAIVPPLVKTPASLAIDENDTSIAGRTDELFAFKEAGKDYALAARLSDIRGILAAGSLTFGDVAAKVAEKMPDEAGRWLELAELEKSYFAALERRGRKDRILAMKEWGARPDCEKWPGIEVVLRFDDPSNLIDDALCAGACISRSQIYPCATPADEAARAAAFFAAVKPGETLPALCVADPAMFPEIVSAFKAKGIDVHDPSRSRLTTSSLGHLVSQITELLRTRSYGVFSSFIRGGDVRRWLCAELGLSDGTMTDILVDLDLRQAEFLPESIDDIAPRTRGRLRAVFDFVRTRLRKQGLRELLASIFAGRTLDGRERESREFAAAAEVVNRLIDECTLIPGEGGRLLLDTELFSLRLNEEVYSLECDEGDAVLTDGWMELPFLGARELVIVGMCEGCVPESTVGHPFLPDSLRSHLGLPCNADREKRDRAIFRLAVKTRGERAVRVSFHSIDPEGDVLKPSRLLLETPDDGDLVERARRYYSCCAGTEDAPAVDIPPGWKLKLPIPPQRQALEKISPTRLDSYLRCPFTYFLRRKDILGDKRMDDRAEELASWEYGNLAHEALEAFGLSDLRDSDDADAIRGFLEERVDAQLLERFGTAIPAIVSLQGESVKRRLADFAHIQSARRREGWTIVGCERKLEVQYGGTRMHGKCDRIDFNPETGRWCVIDYKTWDSADKAAGYDEKKGEWRSLQLPIYCAMLDADAEGIFADARLDRISACYCVLGKTADEVRFTPPMGGGLVPMAEKKIRELVESIEAGIFWPPSPSREWAYDYGDWLMPSPEESVCEEWIKDQLERKSAD